MKKLIILFTLTILLIFNASPALSSEAATESKETTNTQQESQEKTEEHNENASATETEGEAEEEDTGEVSIYFYIQWTGLLIILGLGLYFVLKMKSKHSQDDRKLLALSLTLLAIIVFSMNYIPEIQEYQEPPLLGFMKYLIAVIDGLLLTYYGVLGRHNGHNSSDHTQESSSYGVTQDES